MHARVHSPSRACARKGEDGLHQRLFPTGTHGRVGVSPRPLSPLRHHRSTPPPPATAHRSPDTALSAAPVRGGTPRRCTTQTRALVDAHDDDRRVPSLAHDVQDPHTARLDATWSRHGSEGRGGRRRGLEAGVALDAVRLWARHGRCNGGNMHRASARCDARPLGRRDATAPRAAGALAGLLCPEPMAARRSLPCCGGQRGVSPPRLHAPRLWSRRSFLRRVASALLVFCGAEQRVDQRAERHGPYRIHRTLPASLVT
jgi:hypothetical protein